MACFIDAVVPSFGSKYLSSQSAASDEVVPEQALIIARQAKARGLQMQFEIFVQEELMLGCQHGLYRLVALADAHRVLEAGPEVIEQGLPAALAGLVPGGLGKGALGHRWWHWRS